MGCSVKRLMACGVFMGWLQWSAMAAALDNELLTYPIPPKLQYGHHVDDFTVRARTPGGAWTDLYEYRVTVDQDTHSTASVVQLDFTGEVEIAVQKNNGDFRRVELRPGRDAPKSTVKDGVVYFTIDQPVNLSVEFDGDRLHNLHILAGAPIPRPTPGPNVVFYEAGLHTPADGSDLFRVKSGQTIYVAGGAVLQGTFRVSDVENVRILGRGMIDRPKSGLVVHQARNVSVEGLTFLTPLHGTIVCSSSADVRFADIKSFSDGQWSDGIDVLACKDVQVDRAFIRTSDDSVAVYATRSGGVGDTERVSVKNSTFWPDVAHAMFVGLHGDSNLLADIHFENIDVLNLDEDDPEYQGVMAISAGDTNTVRNVSFKNIRIDRIEEGKLFNVRVVFNEKYGLSPGKAIDGVLFQDIFYTGKGWPGPSWIGGFDEQRRVSNIVFDNVQVAGKKWNGREGLEIRPFVDGVRFK